MFTLGLAIAVLGVLVAPALAQPYQGRPLRVTSRGAGSIGELIRSGTRRLRRMPAGYRKCQPMRRGARVRPGCPPAAFAPTGCAGRRLLLRRTKHSWRSTLGQRNAGVHSLSSRSSRLADSASVYPSATERDILDAQAGAINAFSQCVKSSAPDVLRSSAISCGARLRPARSTASDGFRKRIRAMFFRRPNGNVTPERSVLFVCLGNICRSPTAAGVFRAAADRAGDRPADSRRLRRVSARSTSVSRTGAR